MGGAGLQAAEVRTPSLGLRAYDPSAPHVLLHGPGDGRGSYLRVSLSCFGNTIAGLKHVPGSLLHVPRLPAEGRGGARGAGSTSGSPRLIQHLLLDHDLRGIGQGLRGCKARIMVPPI